MKVDDILTKQLVTTNLTESKEKSTSGNKGFKELLDDEVGLHATSKGTSTGNPTPVTLQTASLFPIVSLQEQNSNTATSITNICQDLDQLLEGLESSDPNLRALENAISSLSSKASDLKGLAEELPEDSNLKTLSDELNVLSYVESIKWKRGDYL